MLEAMLRAFADQAEIGPHLDADARRAEETLRSVEAAGIDLPALTAEFERECVRSVHDSYRQLISCIGGKASPSPGLAELQGQART
jgi:hypothetical protein